VLVWLNRKKFLSISVPETAVNENCFSSRWKSYIRLAG